MFIFYLHGVWIRIVLPVRIRIRDYHCKHWIEQKLYFAVQGFADSELDSEISSLFSYGREVPNLHLMSPLEYAAMLKQVSLLLTYVPRAYLDFDSLFKEVSVPATER